MKEKKITKKQVEKLLLKMVSNKETVQAYMRGEVSLSTLNKKGIKLAKPI